MKKAFVFALFYGSLVSLAAVTVIETFAFLSPLNAQGHYLRYLSVCVVLLIASVGALVFLVIRHVNMGFSSGRAVALIGACVFFPCMWLWSVLLDLIYKLIV